MGDPYNLLAYQVTWCGTNYGYTNNILLKPSTPIIYKQVHIPRSLLPSRAPHIFLAIGKIQGLVSYPILTI